MPKRSTFFSDLIETGEFRVDDAGHAILNGQFLLMIPPPVILRLQDKLADDKGYDEMAAFMKDLGRFQVQQAVERWVDRFGTERLSKNQIINFAENIMKTLGWGEIHVQAVDEDENTVMFEVKHPTLPSVYRNRNDELAEKPICHYLCGMFERGFGAVLENDITVTETHCAATGGNTCTFEGKPTD